MLTLRLKFLFTLKIALFVLKDVCRCSSDDECNEQCSLVHDPVCGEVTARDERVVHKAFHNKCQFNKIRCWLAKNDSLSLEQVDGIECGIASNKSTRRVTDFSIVGAIQACNHTCPTYCVDTYVPVCAKIWDENRKTATYRAMVNHCHVDMLSCVLGRNVTILPLQGGCFSNPSVLNFVLNVASLKSLHLLNYPGSGRRSAPVHKLELEEYASLLQKLL